MKATWRKTKERNNRGAEETKRRGIEKRRNRKRRDNEKSREE